MRVDQNACVGKETFRTSLRLNFFDEIVKLKSFVGLEKFHGAVTVIANYHCASPTSLESSFSTRVLKAIRRN